MIASVIIPSYKRSKLLEKGLESLSQQKSNYPFEVIVLNDGVIDETEKVCNKYKDKLNIRYIFTGHRNISKDVWRVPGFSINVGVKQADSDIIILSSPEIFYMEKDIIERILTPLLNNSKLLVIPYGKNDVYGKILQALKAGSPIDFSMYHKLRHNLPVFLPFCMGMRKENFVDIGGYDEDFTGYCWDDNDIIDRLIMSGCNYHQIQSHIIHLYHEKSFQLETEDEEEQYNYKLYKERKDQVIRNKGKTWGKLDNNLEEKFTDVYKNGIWLQNKSRSGAGSDDENTKILKQEFVKLINELKIDTLLDLGCGDFTWMKSIIDDLEIKKYMGIDIVESVISDNIKKYGSDKVDFVQANIINTILPQSDLILCRDVLLHLSFEYVISFFKNINNFQFKYLLTTTFTDENRENKNLVVNKGYWTPFNLQKKPFNLPKPKQIINEQCTEGDGAFTDKSLGLWKKGTFK